MSRATLSSASCGGQRYTRWRWPSPTPTGTCEASAFRWTTFCARSRPAAATSRTPSTSSTCTTTSSTARTSTWPRASWTRTWCRISKRCGPSATARATRWCSRTASTRPTSRIRSHREQCCSARSTGAKRSATALWSPPRWSSTCASTTGRMCSATSSTPRSLTAAISSASCGRCARRWSTRASPSSPRTLSTAQARSRSMSPTPMP